MDTPKETQAPPAFARKSLAFETVKGVFLGAMSAVIGVPIIELALHSKKITELLGVPGERHMVRDSAVIGAGYSVINGYLSLRDAMKYNRELELLEIAVARQHAVAEKPTSFTAREETKAESPPTPENSR